MRHFAAAEAQSDFDLVALFEKPLHGAHLHIVIVIVDHRPQLDFLDLDDLLLLARLGGFLLRLVFVLAVVEDLADGRARIGGDLHEIEAGVLRHGQGVGGIDDPLIGAVFVDELDLADADLLVDARPLLGSRLRGSDRTTNGFCLLCCCYSPSACGPSGRGTPNGQTQKIGAFPLQVNDNATLSTPRRQCSGLRARRTLPARRDLRPKAWAGGSRERGSRWTIRL